MAKRVHRCFLMDTGCRQCLAKSGLETAFADRLCGIGHVCMTRRRKKPDLVAVGFPLLTQKLQRFLRQRHVAVFVALGLPNVDESTCTVDVFDFQVRALGQAQPAGIDRGQTDAIVLKANTVQHMVNFIPAEHDRQFFVFPGADEQQGWPRAFDGVIIEELDAAQGDGTGAAAPLFDVFTVQKVLPQIFFASPARGLVEVFAQLADGAYIQFLGTGAVAFKLQVFDHPLS